MAEVRFTEPRSFSLGGGFLDRNAWTVVGTNAVQSIIYRIKRARLNVVDAPAKPYSTKGPIYVPLTGHGRTQESLGGRQVITRKDLGRSRAVKLFGAGRATDFLSGLGAGTMAGAGPQFRQATPLGSVTPSGKSVKFANYSEYKKFLGKSGERDLELSGKMLNDIDIIEVGINSVTIGLKSDEQAAKMAGNIAIDDEWGFSPRDGKALLDLVESEGLRQVQARWSSG